MVGHFRSGGPLPPSRHRCSRSRYSCTLPSRQNGMALLLYVQRGCSTLALLDNGVIRRIRTIPVGWPPETDCRRPQSFLIRTGKRRSARIRRPAAARNVPRIGRDAFRTGSPSRLWRGLSRKRRVRPLRRSLRAARFRAWSRSPLGRAGAPAGRNRSPPGSSRSAWQP